MAGVLAAAGVLAWTIGRPARAQETAVWVRPGDIPVRIVHPDGTPYGAGVPVTLVDPRTGDVLRREVSGPHGDLVLGNVGVGSYHLLFGEARIAVAVTPIADARQIAVVGNPVEMGLLGPPLVVPETGEAAGAGVRWDRVAAWSLAGATVAGGATGIALGVTLDDRGEGRLSQ